MKKIFAFLVLLLPGVIYAEPQLSQQYDFSGGLNLNQLATDISASQSPDMTNCVSDPIGSARPRNGTERVFSQAVSTFPVSSVYKVYADTSTDSALLFTNKNSIYYTTGSFNPAIYKATDSLKPYDDFKWLQMSGRAILLGGYDNDIKEFNPITKSVSNMFPTPSLSTGNIYVRAKHGLVLRNYLILSNVKISTSPNFETNISTIYPSRIYFSDLDSRSSFTTFNFIDFANGDGQEITGSGSIYGAAHFFKPSKIQEVTFTVLKFTGNGDVAVNEIVQDFGLRSPKSLVGARLYYAFAADDGIRIWNGSRTSRLTPSDESRVISDDIKPLINRLIRAGTYSNVTMFYYPRKEWLVLSYEDPGRFPTGKNNSMIIYDFKTSQWFPFSGISAQSFAIQSGGDDKGELLYGDNDGYVVEMDKFTRSNDMRKELPIDVMDSSVAWVNSSQDFVNVKTGTASLQVTITPSVSQSSMTQMGTFNFGEWTDKTKITRDDKLKFKAFVWNKPTLNSIRIDLEVNTVSNAFDSNFTSITIPSSSFSEGNKSWTEFEIPFSSFPIRPDWTDFSIENLPFANTLFFYGIRFVVDGSTVSFDDLRIVQNSQENPINFYRFSKLFDLQTKVDKNFGSMLVTMEKSPHSETNIDVYNNFGSKIRTENIASEVPREIISINYSTGVLAVLDSVDFTVKRSTVISNTYYQFFQGVADKDSIWLGDRGADRILKLNRNNLGFDSAFGSFGSGTTNFNLIHQIAKNQTQLIPIDMMNQKIKQYNIINNKLIREFGGLGTSTNTNRFHQPTAIAANENNVYMADEGNYRWLRFNISTMAFELSVPVDYNTRADTSFAIDAKYLYAAYISGSDTSISNTNIILEKRDLTNFDLINRTLVKPKNATGDSSYEHTGDIALLGKHIFIVFNDNSVDPLNANYYIQKRLKEDFSLVSEKIYPKQRMYSILGDSYAYKPMIQTRLIPLKTDGRYIQLKYYGNSLDNDFTLYNQTFLVDVKTQGY